MRLWQKNFLAALLVSLAILFLVCAVLIVENNDRSFQAAKRSARQEFISAMNAVSTSAGLYDDNIIARQQAMARSLAVTSALGSGQFYMVADGQMVYGNRAFFPLPEFPRPGEEVNCVYLDTDMGMVFLCAAQVADCQLYGVWDGESIRYEGRRMALGMGLLVLCAAGMLAMLLYVLSRRMFRPLRALEKGARDIAAGQYHLRLPRVKTKDVNALAQSFNDMAQSVEGHIAALEAENDRQRRFVRNLAHEMKTPMTAMMGYSDLMLAGKVDAEEQQEACRYISQQSRRLNELSQKLMELSKLEHAEEWQFAPVQLISVFHAAAQTAGPMLAKKNIALTLPESDAAMLGDETLLCALITNFLTNACKYSPEGGTVICRITEDEDRILLSVIDQGPGAPDDALPMLTEAFFMADKARSRQENGAGLGLTLCSRIAELHGGKVRFQNLHPGFQVSVILPKNLHIDDIADTTS